MVMYLIHQHRIIIFLCRKKYLVKFYDYHIAVIPPHNYDVTITIRFCCLFHVFDVHTYMWLCDLCMYIGIGRLPPPATSDIQGMKHI